MANIFAGIIIIAIIAGIVAYANPQFFPNMKYEIEEKIENMNVQKIKEGTDIVKQIIITENKKTDTLISKCKTSFNDCKDIYHTKFGISVSISEIEEVNNIDEANEFYNIWKERLPDWNRRGKEYREQKINENGFPQVLIAYSYHSPIADVKLPSITVCNEEGELTQDSKKALSCG